VQAYLLLEMFRVFTGCGKTGVHFWSIIPDYTFFSTCIADECHQIIFLKLFNSSWCGGSYCNPNTWEVEAGSSRQPRLHRETLSLKCFLSLQTDLSAISLIAILNVNV
jgi:hypothetical protein